jgi:transcriptional regulator with GAF, ATPase, and Fis domain
MHGPQLDSNVLASAERYRTLLEINNALITQLTRETLLRSVLEILRRVVSLNGAAIAIYDPASETFGYFLMETTLSSDHFRAGVEFDRKDSISSWVCDHQCAVVRGDLENEQQYPNDRIAVAAGIYSDCIVPLIVAGKSCLTCEAQCSGSQRTRQLANRLRCASMANSMGSG